MATTMYGLWASAAENGALDDRNYNDAIEALDLVGLGIWHAFKGGARSGWTLPINAGKSTVQSGQGFIGPVYCRTTASQVISGLFVGTDYIYAKTGPSSAWGGAIIFAARSTSGGIANADGVSSGVLLGKLTYNGTTGVTSGSADSALRQRHYAYRWHREAVSISMTAGATTAVSEAYAFATAMRIPMLSALVSVAGSQWLRYDTLTGSGFVVHLYNRNSNAGTTYSQDWIWEGLRRV